MPDAKRATLYRMVLADHECPFGLKAKALLEETGYQIDEHILTSRAEVDAFEAEHGVATTVASTPVKNDPAKPDFVCKFPPTLVARKPNSNTPLMFIAKTSINTASTKTNTGD